MMCLLHVHVSKQVLYLKNLKLHQFRILQFFVKKNRQIEWRSALLSKNVNKLSRVFRLFLILDDFLSNFYPKLVWTPGSKVIKQVGQDFNVSTVLFTSLYSRHLEMMAQE